MASRIRSLVNDPDLRVEAVKDKDLSSLFLRITSPNSTLSLKAANLLAITEWPAVDFISNRPGKRELRVTLISGLELKSEAVEGIARDVAEFIRDNQK